MTVLALTGALTTERKSMDLFSVIVTVLTTALGGTVREVLLNDT